MTETNINNNNTTTNTANNIILDTSNSPAIKNITVGIEKPIKNHKKRNSVDIQPNDNITSSYTNKNINVSRNGSFSNIFSKLLNNKGSDKLDLNRISFERPISWLLVKQLKSEEGTAPNQLTYLHDLYGCMVIPRIYLGSRHAALDKDWLNDHNITHILTVAHNLKPVFPQLYTYKVIRIKDRQNENILEHFDSCHQFIEEALSDERNNVLIHCQAGVSRSASALTAYLMKAQRIQYDKALTLIISKRSFVCPNLGFRYQLQLYEQLGCDQPKKHLQYWRFLIRMRGKAFIE
ncbi:3945_t:CDS:2 [Ambispora gerdemannii]|uniref:protein-tyrosine-phosphatase n=1 Tax=Ambispora gerdemannii TaxID=144530 RepID=A0A9N9CP72_9GLOM|nr:3945_t:CDS:2 [Ambispora gerdemannii]